MYAPPAWVLLQLRQFQMPVATRFTLVLPQNEHSYLLCWLISIWGLHREGRRQFGVAAGSAVAVSQRGYGVSSLEQRRLAETAWCAAAHLAGDDKTYLLDHLPEGRTVTGPVLAPKIQRERAQRVSGEHEDAVFSSKTLHW